MGPLPGLREMTPRAVISPIAAFTSFVSEPVFPISAIASMPGLAVPSLSRKVTPASWTAPMSVEKWRCREGCLV